LELPIIEPKKVFDIHDYLLEGRPHYQEIYAYVFKNVGLNWEYLPSDVMKNREKMENRDKFNDANYRNAKLLSAAIEQRSLRDPTDFINPMDVRIIVTTCDEMDKRVLKFDVDLNIMAEYAIDVYAKIYEHRIHNEKFPGEYVICLDGHVCKNLSKPPVGQCYVAAPIAGINFFSADSPAMIYDSLSVLATQLEHLPIKQVSI
jgi:hypothetical protein